MRPALLLLTAVLLSSALCAQGLPQVRVVVDEDGLYEIPYRSLSKLLDLRRVRTDDLGLFRKGEEIPMHIRGGTDGRLDAGDSIVFFGERSHGPHSKDASYILGRSQRPRRTGTITPNAGAETVDEAWRMVTVEEDLILVPLACIQDDVIRKRKDGVWCWRRLPARLAKTGDPATRESMGTFSCEIHPEPRRSIASRLSIDVLGPPVPGVEQKIAVNLNGTDLPPIAWNTALEKKLEFTVPAGIVERKNSIQIRNLSRTPYYAEKGNEVGRRIRNALHIDRITLTVPTLLMGPMAHDDHVIYRLRNPLKPLAFTTLTREGFLLYDLNHHALGRGGPIKPGQSDEVVVAGVGMGGLKSPKTVEAFRPTKIHLSGPGADWVVVTTSRFKRTLKPLVEHRRGQGLVPLVMEARELYDTFTHGDFDPAAIRKFVQQACLNWKQKPRYLLLVGDADHGCDWLSTKETLPTCMVMTDYNGSTATDAPFGDVDGDGQCEVAVGRLPLRTQTDLMQVIARTIDLERRPPSGAWRRRVRFVAGEARFNPIVDGLLQRTFRSIVGKEVPAAFRLSMTWSNPRSPFYWPANRFSDRVVSEFNEGALVFTYVGHGSTEAFDRIRDRGLLYPILDEQSIHRIDAGGRNAVLAIIACWTGNFDRPGRDSISELLIRQRGGPAAVLASSRISHPFPDALLGLGLARAFFNGRQRLGDVFESARRIMLKEADGKLGTMAKPFLSKAIDPSLLVRDHLWLYNLLGDPATRMPLPERDLALKAPEKIPAGQPLTVHVECGETGGHLLVTLDLPFARQGSGLKVPKAGAPDRERVIVDNHRKANDPTVASTQLRVEGGLASVILDIPTDLPPGPYNITAYLVGEGKGDALGAIPVKVTKPAGR